MSEFPAWMAYRTPTKYSDDVRTPFEDIGMGEWNDAEKRKFFAGKTVLDIGSGIEGFGRGLHKLFVGLESAKPRIVSLNPQFADWSRDSENKKRYGTQSIKKAIGEDMELYGEQTDSYLSTRVAIAGLVQQLPFGDNSFDIVLSTWAFPNCFFDCFSREKDHEAGYRETLRVLRPKGIARLAPVRDYELKFTEAIIEGLPQDSFDYDFVETTEIDYAVELIKAAA